MSDAALWSKTPPTEPAWRFWKHPNGTITVIDVRRGANGRLCWSILGDKTEFAMDDILPGEWGPRIDMPIAAPVECFQVTDESGGVFLYACRDEIDLDCAFKIIRGVFVPLETATEGRNDDR